MRWDSLFSGYQSLWDSELDNEELDERREIVRADRATRPFVVVLCERARGGPLVAGIDGTPGAIHLRRVGSTWIEGIDCETGLTVLAPIHSVQWFGSREACACRHSDCRVVEHVTFGARLRVLERENTPVAVTFRGGGVNGRVIAVWRDACDIRAGSRVISVAVGTMLSIVVDGP